MYIVSYVKHFVDYQYYRSADRLENEISLFKKLEGEFTFAVVDSVPRSGSGPTTNIILQPAACPIEIKV